MSWSKAMSEAEIDFIRNSYKSMSAKKIAKKLNRSERVVYNYVKKFRDEEKSGAPRARVVQESQEFDALGDLMSLRDVLRRAMLTCEERNLPKITAEYREVIKSIEELNGGAGDDDDELSRLICSIDVRTP